MLELFYKKRKDDRVSVAQKTFKADENELPAVQEFVREELKKYDISSRTLNQIELAVVDRVPRIGAGPAESDFGRSPEGDQQQRGCQENAKFVHCMTISTDKS